MESVGISVIITAYNEGRELHETLHSVIDGTQHLEEVIIVDDGSDDGSCCDLSSDGVSVLRHDSRIGVAYSRDQGSRAATGNVLCYLDGHQRVSKGCLDRHKIAIERNSITCPDLQNYGWFKAKLHGATFELVQSIATFRQVGVNGPRCVIRQRSPALGRASLPDSQERLCQGCLEPLFAGLGSVKHRWPLKRSLPKSESCTSPKRSLDIVSKRRFPTIRPGTKFGVITLSLLASVSMTLPGSATGCHRSLNHI